MAKTFIRLIQEHELPELLVLYRHLNEDDPILPINDALQKKWQAMLNNPMLKYYFAEKDNRIAGTCTLTIIPNLTRGGRPYGLIENVVTLPDYRRQGVGTDLLQHVMQEAWLANCYKVMLMTSRKDEATLRFYAQAGFQAGIKTGFVAKAPN